MRVIMLHGYKGTPDNGWFSTIQRQLNQHGINFTSPSLPDPANPNYDNWKKSILELLLQDNENDFLIVAHSLACFAILKIFDEIDNIILLKKIKHVILVAPVVSYMEKFSVFTNYQFQWNNLQHIFATFDIFYSIDDTYVPEIDMKRFIERFPDKKKINYHEKSTYGHFMQDDLPFLTDFTLNLILQ
ncbi:hypothetical protein TRFO_02792 [Tritrichomonas foetus]|uniref:Uncharacterized protein n=1 Tax=Tritrichomonas foetus TaxID=1144522 RepID=A0A1J4KW81_9EUKA|nr:hypothetical protein TRFO_02792 [Tritrichomonas foetus]|eukprot:OHT15487.1 hypothetical protein TRFO_02792 [Tritrichomonas foetus]